MSRYARSEVDIDARFDDRRSRNGRHYDDQTDIEVDFRRGSGAPPVRTREREETRTPAFLRDDYGQTTAGPMVLRARDREDVTYAAPRRRRSPSPERKEREEIIIRRDERSESRPPAPRPRPREEEREKEEIIIRRDERSSSRPAPRRRREESREREEIIIKRSDERSDSAPIQSYRRPREESREREEIIIRREERSESRPPPRRQPREQSREREEIIIKRSDERDSYAPPRRAPPREERDREEIIIRRDKYESEPYVPPPPPPPPREELERSEIIIRRNREQDYDDRSSYAPPPPRSRYSDDVRPKSHERSRGGHGSESEDEIIIRREERDRGRGEETRQEIIIRKSSRSRSPSPATTVSTRPPPVQEPQAPPIVYAPQIHQEVITHHRHIDHGYEVRQPVYREPAREVYSRPPSPPSPPPAPAPPPVREESEERIEIRRSETRNGRSENQDIVISRRDRSQSAPPRREYQRDDFEIDYSHERDYQLARAEPLPPPTIGSRWAAKRDPRDRLWTEITKDLVVKEAIREMGYEFEETEENYYIFKYMEYADVARLVGLSEDIRRDRAKRINEIRWENEFAPRPSAPSAPRTPLPIEGPRRPDSRGWNREEERYVEREVVYRGGRPPPPPGWRR